MGEITIEAKAENQDAVIDFINAEISRLNCPENIRRQIDTAASEVFANISDYAYGKKTGEVTVVVQAHSKPPAVELAFIDGGIPFNPLTMQNPDTAAPLERRGTGGLGIFIIKKSMDTITYERKGNKNILRIQKKM